MRSFTISNSSLLLVEYVDGRQKRTHDTHENANAFRHGLSAIQRRRADGELTEDEQDFRAGILAGLIADKGGEQMIGTAERILAEIISSDVSLLVTVNQAIEGVRETIRKRDRTPRHWRN